MLCLKHTHAQPHTCIYNYNPVFQCASGMVLGNQSRFSDLGGGGRSLAGVPGWVSQTVCAEPTVFWFSEILKMSERCIYCSICIMNFDCCAKRMYPEKCIKSLDCHTFHEGFFLTTIEITEES